MVKGYRDWLLAKGCAINSVNQRLSILRKMADPANNFLSKSQIRALLDTLPDTPQGRRDRLMLALFVYLAGCRRSQNGTQINADFGAKSS